MSRDIFDYNNIRNGISHLKERGIGDIFSKVTRGMKTPLKGYNSWYREKYANYRKDFSGENADAENEIIKDDIHISIIMVIDALENDNALDGIESVIGQIYEKWELLLIDRCQGKNRDRIFPYAEADSRIKYISPEVELEQLQCLNIGFSVAKGEYIGVIYPGDILPPWSLYVYVREIQYTKYDVLYGDEDIVSYDGGKYSEPVFKPAFSPELIRAYNYIGHFPLVRAALGKSVGGYHQEYAEGADYDYILRCIENQVNGIKHIPEILYHRRKNKKEAIGQDEESGLNERTEYEKKALENHIKRLGLYGTVSGVDNHNNFIVTFETPGNPLLSIVISSVADTDMLKKLILSFYDGVRYSNFEIILVENNTGDGRRLKFLEKMEEIRKNFRVVFCEAPFNKWQMRNLGAGYARGEYIFFADSNIQVRSPYALGNMLGMCMQEKVGLVSGTLVTEDNYIWEKGMVLGLNGIACPLFQGVREDGIGYMKLNLVNTNHNVTGNSCIMIKKALYNIIGGYSDKFTTQLNELDFCLKIKERGYRITALATAKWTYCKYNKPGDGEKEKKEEELFRILWGTVLAAGDEFYNANFKKEGNEFTI